MFVRPFALLLSLLLFLTCPPAEGADPIEEMLRAMKPPSSNLCVRGYRRAQALGQRLFPPKPQSAAKQQKAIERLRKYLEIHELQPSLLGLYQKETLAASSKQLKAQGVAHGYVDDSVVINGTALEITPMEKGGTWLNRKAWELQQETGALFRFGIKGNGDGGEFTPPNPLNDKPVVYLPIESIVDPHQTNWILDHEVGHAQKISSFRKGEARIPYGNFSCLEGLPYGEVGVINLHDYGYRKFISADEPDMQGKSAQDLEPLYRAAKAAADSDPKKVKRWEDLYTTFAIRSYLMFGQRASLSSSALSALTSRTEVSLEYSRYFTGWQAEVKWLAEGKTVTAKIPLVQSTGPTDPENRAYLIAHLELLRDEALKAIPRDLVRIRGLNETVADYLSNNTSTQ